MDRGNIQNCVAAPGPPKPWHGGLGWVPSSVGNRLCELGCVISILQLFPHLISVLGFSSAYSIGGLGFPSPLHGMVQAFLTIALQSVCQGPGAGGQVCSHCSHTCHIIHFCLPAPRVFLILSLSPPKTSHLWDKDRACRDMNKNIEDTDHVLMKCDLLVIHGIMFPKTKMPILSKGLWDLHNLKF